MRCGDLSSRSIYCSNCIVSSALITISYMVERSLYTRILVSASEPGPGGEGVARTCTALVSLKDAVARNLMEEFSTSSSSLDPGNLWQKGRKYYNTYEVCETHISSLLSPLSSHLSPPTSLFSPQGISIIMVYQLNHLLTSVCDQTALLCQVTL